MLANILCAVGAVAILVSLLVWLIMLGSTASNECPYKDCETCPFPCDYPAQNRRGETE